MTVRQPSIAGSRQRRRDIGPLGTAARAGVGTWFIIDAFQIGVTPLDAVLGLIVANAAIWAALALRGWSAPPLRMTGPVSHVVNIVVVITALNVFDVPALLFYGSASVLAAIRGDGACEMFAVWNWLRRRDDQFGCPFYLPVDLIDHHVTARAGGC